MARDLSLGFVDQMAAEVFILQTIDVVFAPCNGLKEQLIIGIEEIETGERSVVVFGGTRKFLELIISGTGIVDRGDEFEVATIGCSEKFAQGGKAVDSLLHGSPLGFAGSIAMFYLTVVFEKGDVVDGGFDAEDERELVVHLDGDRSHGVFDAGAFNANVETVAHFVLIVTVEFVAEERSDVIGFYSVNRSADQIVVNGCQIRLPLKDHIAI